MKKIVAFLSLFLIAISCSVDDDQPNVHYELVPVESVNLEDTLTVGLVNNIEINYKKPSTCHGFDGFYYEKNGFERIIGVQNYVIEQTDCQPITNITRQEVLKFKPTEVGTYTFKFWQGKDTNGEDIFLEIERPVVIN